MKKDYFVFILLLLASLANVRGQLQLDWAHGTGSAVSDFTGSLQIDHESNTYVFSMYHDTTDLDPGPGTAIYFPSLINFASLTKYDATGSLEWAGIFTDGSRIYGTLLEIRNNRLRLTVHFTDSLIYRVNGNTLLEHHQAGKYICYLDLTLSGEVLRTVYIPAPYEIYFHNLITLPDGNTFVGGGFYDTMYLSSVQPYHTDAGDGGGFIALLDQNMEPVWVKTFSTPGEDWINAVYVAGDRLYFAGYHEDTLQVATSSGTEILPADGFANSFFGYISLNGTIEQILKLGGPMDDEIKGIAVDSEHNIYVCGYFEDTVNFAHPSQVAVVHTAIGEDDGFVARYDADGQLDWVNIYTNTYYGGTYTLDLKRGNELYVSGGFTYRADLDPGPDSLIFETNSNTDVYVSKLMTDGQWVWSYVFPGNSYEGIRNVRVSTEDAKVYVHGYFFNEMDCDPSADSLDLVSRGGSDIFLIALAEENVTTAIGPEPTAPAVKVFPNPATDHISIVSDIPASHLSICDVNGKVIRTFSTPGTRATDLDVSGLAPGIYLLQYQAAGTSLVQKLVKMQ